MNKCEKDKQSLMDATEDSEEHSVIWRMFVSSTLQASVFLVKNYSDNWHSIKNTKDLTTKQVFDISAKLVSEQSDEIYGVNTINWEDSSWNIYLWLVVKKSSVSRTQRFTYFQIVLCLAKVNQNPTSNAVWEEKLSWFKDSPQYRTLVTIDGEPMEFDWNIFPGFTTLQLVQEVQKFINRMGEPEQFQGRVIFMSMFNDISWGSEDNEQECNANADLVSIYARRFSPGKWTFLGLGSDYSRIQTTRRMGQSCGANDDNIFRKRTPSSPCHKSIVPGNAQKQMWWKNYQYTSVLMRDTIETVFRTVISVNQLSIYGAVSNLCEECKTCHARTGETCARRTI